MRIRTGLGLVLHSVPWNPTRTGGNSKSNSTGNRSRTILPATSWISFSSLPAAATLTRYHKGFNSGLPIETTTPDGKSNYQLIRTGDVFTFTTADPENLPLPNRNLLEMQWYLLRVTAMSGAAEAIAEYRNDDDDDMSE
jgi:hypothetical protein